MTRFFAVVAALLLTESGLGQGHPSADLIITNAKVHTVDRAKPLAEAVAVLGNRVVAVGNKNEIDGWRGPRTRVIDAHGKLVLPGFNDAHVHFLDSGLAMDSVHLKDASSPQEFRDCNSQKEGLWHGSWKKRMSR